MPEPKFLYSKWAKNKPDIHASQLEKDRFWERERQRWIEGWNNFTGYHYFYLTQCKIKSEEGIEIHPEWRDADEYIFGLYDQAIKQRKDLIIIKRRGVGLTTIFGGVIPILNSIIHRGSTNLLTSASQARIDDMFPNKLSVIYQNLDPAIKPNRAYMGQGKRMRFAKKHTKNEMIGGKLYRKGEESGLQSEIKCEETVKDPKAFEGERAMSIFLDEFFLHPFAPDVRESSQACLRRSMVKVSPLVMGGSCGVDEIKHSSSQKISSKAIQNAEQLWNDAEHLDIIKGFIPAWMGISAAEEYDDKGEKTGRILNLCPNGYSDEKAASEYIEKTRERLNKAESKTAYNTFVANYPLTKDEVFSSFKSGIWAKYPDIIPAVAKQKKYIQNTPPPVARFDLTRNRNGIIASFPNQKGDFFVLEHPKAEKRYISGTDPYGWNSKNMAEGSDYAIVIKDIDTNTYVAFYRKRSLNSSLIVSDVMTLQDYYNRCKTMIEMNHGGVAENIYKEKGRLELLAKRPDYLGIDFVNKKDDMYGWWKNVHTAARAYDYLFEYLLDNMGKIYFKEVLAEIPDFITFNTDLLDAMVSCELYHKNYLALQLKQIKPKYIAPASFRYSRDSQGRTVLIEVKKVINFDGRKPL